MNLHVVRQKLISRVRRFVSDVRGVSAVEFAIALPLMLVLVWGEYVVCDAIGLKRKMTIASHTIGDLISRQGNLTSTSLATILNASKQVMLPYSASGANIVVAQLAIDANGKATVSWSSAVNGTGLVSGATVQIPSGVAQPSTKIIYASISYDYAPFVGQALFPKIGLKSTFYTYPRTAASVNYSG